ncbi:MAG: hypothetical protein R3B09_06455 [Nannocystaceae bacterium]
MSPSRRPLAPLVALILAAASSGCGPREGAPPTERAADAERGPAPAREPVAPPAREAGDPSAEEGEAASPPVTDLELLVWTGDEDPCPEQARGDCHSQVEINGDGRLRLDAWGAPGSAFLEAGLSDDELRAVAAVVTAPGLLALLDQGKVCPEANATEAVQVRLRGVDHQNQTGYCNGDAVQAVRRALLDLVGAHFSGHHMISPPF